MPGRIDCLRPDRLWKFSGCPRTGSLGDETPEVMPGKESSQRASQKLREHHGDWWEMWMEGWRVLIPVSTRRILVAWMSIL